MLITYIHHSCFSIETEHSVLLFDYYKGNIPNFPKEKPIFVFSSHSHQDHFNPVIFSLMKQYPIVTYVFSKDIRLKESFFTDTDEYEAAKKRVITVDKNETYSLSQDLTATTFRSTDAGVAFLLTENGRTIYHAGDLNWWVWKDDTKSEYTNMTKNFQAEIDKLKDRKIDVAFLPLDPRQEELYSLGFDYFMKNTITSHSFPMHFWQDYSIIQKFKTSEEASDYQDKIVVITKEDEVFQII